MQYFLIDTLHQYQYLSNRAPATPPTLAITQQRSTENNLGLMLG